MDFSEFNTIPAVTNKDLMEINKLFTPYIFYKRIKYSHPLFDGTFERREKYECTCSNCLTSYEYDYDGKKTGDIAECPYCKRDAALKHISRGRKSLHEEQQVVLIKKLYYNTIWLRAFYCYKEYRQAVDDLPQISETARYRLRPGEVDVYKYEHSWKKRSQWVKRKNPIEPFNNVGFGQFKTYYILGEENLKGSFLKYLDLSVCYKDYGKYITGIRDQPVADLKLVKYICRFTMYPITESLVKAGFIDIIGDAVVEGKEHRRLYNWQATRLATFFKSLNRAEIRWLSKFPHKTPQLTLLTLYKKASKHKTLAAYERYNKQLEQDGIANFKTKQDLLTFAVKYKLTPERFYGYLKKQFESTNVCLYPIGAIIEMYRDYVKFATDLKLDLKNEVVLMPKCLKEAHDNAAQTLTAIKAEKEKQAMQELTKKLKAKYDFEYGDYIIKVPESMQEIINEGKALCHCVGGYAHRHAEGTVVILFLRKKTDYHTPFVTIEMNGNKHVQYHGYKNDTRKPLPKSVKDFMQEFETYLKSPAAYLRKLKNQEKSA